MIRRESVLDVAVAWLNLARVEAEARKQVGPDKVQKHWVGLIHTNHGLVDSISGSDITSAQGRGLVVIGTVHYVTWTPSHGYDQTGGTHTHTQIVSPTGMRALCGKLILAQKLSLTVPKATRTNLNTARRQWSIQSMG